MTCQADIKLQRKEDNSGWLRFEVDGHTIHRCKSKKQPQQPTNSPLTQIKDAGGGGVVVVGMFKEVAAIKAQLLVLVARLDRIEQELGK